MKRSQNLLVLLLLLSFPAFSQSDIPLFKYTGTEFSDGINKWVSKFDMVGVYVTNYVAKNYFDIRAICNEGVALVRFKFDSLGRITDVGCSTITPREIAKAFKEAVQASQQYWVHQRGVLVSDRWYVLPVVYSYGINCKAGKIQVGFSMRGGPFEFDDGSPLTTLNCIMFEPWITHAGVDEGSIR